jgi:2-keto-4-pentenoate hydratase/2-oxohepta-3-ene-1,7-dioic acid hydratase in catechol pathway
MVTKDEIPDVNKLTLKTRLNGQQVQETGIDLMLFPIPVLIAYITTFTQLNPGDVISTGTPGGVGVKRTPQLFMKPGDSVEVEISSIGILQNKVIEQ